MKKTAALLLCLSLLLSLSACSLPFGQRESGGEAPRASEAPARRGSVTLQLAADESGTAGLDRALAQLKKELPGIGVSRAELTGDTLSGQLPDLLLLSRVEAQRLADEGKLLALTGQPEAADTLSALPAAELAFWQAGEGRLFLLPTAPVETWCLFANEARFAAHGLALPQSAEELLDCARVFGDAGETLLAVDAEEESLLALLELCLRGAGSSLPAIFSGEESPYDEAVLAAAQELYRLQRTNAVVCLTREECETRFHTGEAAVYFAPEHEAAAARDTLGEAAVLLPLPLFGSGETALGAEPGAPVLAVSASSEHPAEAVTAACRLCELLREEPGSDPLSASLSARRAALRELLPAAHAPEASIDAAFASGVKELLLGTMTPDEFVECAELAFER